VTSPTTTASCRGYGAAPSVTSANGATARADGAFTFVNCPNGLTLTKTADAASVNAGSNIGFTITVTIGGPVTATGVTMGDFLPSGGGVSWSLSPAVAGCSISSSKLICSLGDLPAATSVQVHVTSPTTTASCGIYNNTAVASSSNNFAQPSSNQASEQVICPPSP